ncbi:MAG: deoxyhypusine synthase [Candidatus Altiarchaeota archaeon]
MEYVEDITPTGGGMDFRNTGFQATRIGEAREMIERMKQDGCTIFLSFTANMMASGLRGVFIEMAEKRMVDAVITTGGSIDHDIIRAFKPYRIGGFNEDDVRLHKKGVNRIGNILVPNDRYELLERKTQPLLKKIYGEKSTVTPRELTEHFARNIKKKTFIGTCLKNNIPVFTPGITDSALGLQMFFFRQKHRDFMLDPLGDMQAMIDLAYDAEKTGGIILGGGISKHHTLGVNLLRGGLDYAVYVTTALEYDGSLSGAMPREAKSWGKIRENGGSVTVYSDATIALPLILEGIL